MAGWIAPNQMPKPIALNRIDRDFESCVLSPKPALNLMLQNCDLPPPLKLFSGPDETFHSSISKIYSQEAREDQQLHGYKEDDKLELLKALRLSQTRAREAERKLTVLSKEKAVLSNLLLRDSSRLFAHRQWVSLMELQVLKLQKQQQEERGYAASGCGDKSRDEGTGGQMWHAAIATFCLAIAGVGFAFGCRYLL